MLEAHQKRLELHSIEQNIRALQYGASAARAGAWPHIDGIGDATYRQPESRWFQQEQKWHGSWSIGAQATWQYGDTLTQAGSLAARLRRAGSGPERAAAAAQSGDRQRGARRVSRSRAGAGQPGEAARRARRGASRPPRASTDLFRAGGATGTGARYQSEPERPWLPKALAAQDEAAHRP